MADDLPARALQETQVGAVAAATSLLAQVEVEGPPVDLTAQGGGEGI